MYYESKHVYVDEIIPIFDGKGLKIAYSISFASAGTPMGYFVFSLDMSLESPIIEYTLSGYSIFDTLMQMAIGSSGRSSVYERERIIISPTWFNYAVPVLSYGEYYYIDIFNSFIEKYEFEIIARNLTISKRAHRDAFILENRAECAAIHSGKNLRDGILNRDQLTGTFSQTLILNAANIMTDRGWAVMSDFPGRRDHCGPTVATNVLIYWSSRRTCLLINGSATETFDALRVTMNFNDRPVLISRVRSGLIGYEVFIDYTVWPQTYTFLSWSNVTTEVRANNPLVTGLALIPSGNDLMTGHFVLTVGHATTTLNGTVTRYLSVVDGWSNAIRYAIFDGFFTYMDGLAVDIR